MSGKVKYRVSLVLIVILLKNYPFKFPNILYIVLYRKKEKLFCYLPFRDIDRFSVGIVCKEKINQTINCNIIYNHINHPNGLHVYLAKKSVLP